jgi:hypothetical protein
MKTEPVSPPSDKFAIAISVPLIFEYEDALKCLESSAITEQDIGDFVDSLCEIGHHQEIESYLKFIQYAVAELCRKRPSPYIKNDSI